MMLGMDRDFGYGDHFGKGKVDFYGLPSSRKDLEVIKKLRETKA